MSFAQRAMSFAQPAGPSTKIKYPGKRVAQIVKLKKDCVQKYKECHAKVWPEVLMQIKQSNIEDCEFCWWIFFAPGIQADAVIFPCLEARRRNCFANRVMDRFYIL